MPKVLIYITRKATWIFLFYDTDSLENRAHVHVGKKGMNDYCKIWLEPLISIADEGDLTEKQLKNVIEIIQKHHQRLMNQWKVFKEGGKVKMLTIKE